MLLRAVPDSLALRASIVIGARSRSFRLLVRLVERMPVLTLPAWQRYRTQPIDERDIDRDAGRSAATARSPARCSRSEGRTCSATARCSNGSPRLMLVGRPALRLRCHDDRRSRGVWRRRSPVRTRAGVPLMEGLQGDCSPREDHAAERLGVSLHSFDAAVEHALGRVGARRASAPPADEPTWHVASIEIAARPRRRCGRW